MEIREEAIGVLVEKAAALFGKDPSGLNENTSFEADLNCKSVGYVQLSAALEDEFDVEVPYMELTRRSTFGEVADYIASLFE